MSTALYSRRRPLLALDRPDRVKRDRVELVSGIDSSGSSPSREGSWTAWAWTRWYEMMC